MTKHDKKIIRVVPRSNPRLFASTKGFTLLELTVVIAIIILLSGIVLTNYRVGEREYALLRSAHKLAQDLRQVEKMAMASETLPSSSGGWFPQGGYGIYFNQQENPNSYTLFADCNNNQNLDTVYTCIENSAPEEIKELFLEEKIKISNLELFSETFGTIPVSSFSVTFFPPDPVIKIISDFQEYDSATITLTYSDGEIKTVKINTVGLIEIH